MDISERPTTTADSLTATSAAETDGSIQTDDSINAMDTIDTIDSSDNSESPTKKSVSKTIRSPPEKAVKMEATISSMSDGVRTSIPILGREWANDDDENSAAQSGSGEANDSVFEKNKQNSEFWIIAFVVGFIVVAIFAIVMVGAISKFQTQRPKGEVIYTSGSSIGSDLDSQSAPQSDPKSGTSSGLSSDVRSGSKVGQSKAG